jgi:hypothetical protein
VCIVNTRASCAGSVRPFQRDTESHRLAGVSGTVIHRQGWAERTADLHRRLLPQKENLCGAFWGAIVLRDAGFDNVDQDLVALEAGAQLPPGTPEPPLPGVQPVTDYRFALPVTDERRAGTASAPLARAIEWLSGGSLAVIPVCRPFTTEKLVELVGSFESLALIANIDTGVLWGAGASDEQLGRHLDFGEDDGPPPDWHVGHYVNPVSVEHGSAGALVTIRDTYPVLGRAGVHRQPAERLAAALRRSDGRQGGVLCVCSAERRAGVEADLTGRGFDICHWDNGTPDPGEEV